ncbi:uncharacterized protein LOC106073230 [Biomphalaria glabrata]|uniref:Uncharacterized protein LOC106073230 n=1 Tax=Biomphalaria glabrata TaxID=6526 RepID=A0A9W3ADM5_BIOGL|nr:uncharacterized protein LOC106073230 [Biomphalaria glabrata]
MSGHNYNILAASKNSSEIPSTVSPGIDLYRASFNDSELIYDWCHRSQSLSEILRDHQLPLVVKLCNDNTVKENEAPIDLQQPLLLYKEVRGIKLHARSITSRPASHDLNKTVYSPVGPDITFADIYAGFFKDLDTKDHHLLTIADVTRVMPKSFLSSKECDGFLSIQQLEGDLFQKTTLPLGLYRPRSVLEDTIAYTNKRKSHKKKLVRCLKCEDERGKHVLFPLEAKGIFYIAELNAAFVKTSLQVSQSCRIYKWTDFDVKKIKGMRVRLMHGSPPQQECQFTGLMELSHVSDEHTVVVSTMNSAPRLFEMAVTSEPFFTVALNTKDFELSDQHQKSLKFARLESENYIGRAKVKRDYGIDEVVSQT